MAQKKLSSVLAAGVIALAGAGFAGCGDDDSEGPAEDAGKAVDEAGRDAGQELEEAGKEAERELDDDGKKD
jgi:hypothetical protein